MDALDQEVRRDLLAPGTFLLAQVRSHGEKILTVILWLNIHDSAVLSRLPVTIAASSLKQPWQIGTNQMGRENMVGRAGEGGG